jgi:hypothetical protein
MKIINSLFTCLALFGITFGASAQESTFNSGDIVLNSGLGLGTSLYSGVGYSSIFPPISISGEYGFREDFLTPGMTLGLGAYLGFAGAEYRSNIFGDTWGWKYNYTVIGGRAAVHYPFIENLDTYGGLMLSYNAVSITNIGNVPPSANPVSGRLGLSIYAGGRYYFSEQFAGMLELGYGISYLNLGVAFKL